MPPKRFQQNTLSNQLACLCVVQFDVKVRPFELNQIYLVNREHPFIAVLDPGVCKERMWRECFIVLNYLTDMFLELCLVSTLQYPDDCDRTFIRIFQFDS